jgi:hypothetical protein
MVRTHPSARTALCVSILYSPCPVLNNKNAFVGIYKIISRSRSNYNTALTAFFASKRKMKSKNCNAKECDESKLYSE